jgi:ribosome-associated heat shock protein Hsp15
MAGDKIRIDKWLWCVRIFKSRTSATDACKAGKVKLNLGQAKPSTVVTAGDKIELKRNGFTFTFKVNTVLKSRVSAVLAAPCYENITPQEELDKYKSWFTGKGGPERRDKGAGRPTKKDRRFIEEFKNIENQDPMWYMFEEE